MPSRAGNIRLDRQHADTVDRAFSLQSVLYDQTDRENPILQEWREQVYKHVARFTKNHDSLLELNAGTGIDATHFAKSGLYVTATDVAEGMVRELNIKATHFNTLQFRVKHCSYDSLADAADQKYDYLFSNMGGLNCISDLKRVTTQFDDLMKPGAYATLVIMPPISLWELSWILKGSFKKAFRRLIPANGIANVEGQQFQTYYHSVRDVADALGAGWRKVLTEGIGTLSAPPAASNFYRRFPKLNRWLRAMDLKLSTRYPFNRCGDHVIITFQKIF